MTRLRALLALLFGLLGVIVPGQLAEAKVGDGGCAEYANQTIGLPANGWQDYMTELADGADTEHYATWLMDEIGVSDGKARHVYTYCWTITGVWHRLKDAEVAKMDALTEQRPELVVGGDVAERVTIPIAPDATFVDYSPANSQQTSTSRYRQQIPASRERTGWTPPNSNAQYNKVTVAVIDTGIDFFHPDLDVRPGFDCTMSYPDRWQNDPHGHGTHVFGTIGANDDHQGTAGFAAGVPGIPLPVLGDAGWGTMASVACGVDQAVKFGADVANLSLGGSRPPSTCGGGSPYVNVFCAAVESGMDVVVAAGNAGTDAWNQSPANIDPVITVGASSPYGPPLPGCSIGTPENSFATFSSYGTFVDIVSPSGVCEYSTVPGGRYAWSSGTSMAAPGVAGVLAAFKATQPTQCWDEPGEAWKWLLRWSELWMDDEGQYGDWVGPPEDQPPLLRFGPQMRIERIERAGRTDVNCYLEEQS